MKKIGIYNAFFLTSNNLILLHPKPNPQQIYNKLMKGIETLTKRAEREIKEWHQRKA